MREKTNIVVVVEGGLVTAVYADPPENIFVNVADLDAQDEQELGEAQITAEKAEKAMKMIW